MKLQTSVAIGIVLLLAGCTGQPDPAARMRQQQDQAIARGKRAFSEELAQHNLTWYVYGDQTFTGFDRNTGLPEQIVSAGVVDPVDSVFAKAHNDQILEYMARNGPPPGSFKQWEPQLFNQAEYFTRQSRTEPPVQLRVGGPPVKSPDGRYTLVLQWADSSTALITRPGPQLLIVTAQGQHETSAPAGGTDTSAEILFTRENPDLAFTRWLREGKPTYAALDLRAGRWLVIRPRA